ncbi:MAG: transposase [Candidatus Omnitrophota bacterium]
MARPLRIEYPGAFYHISARGNDKNEIFTTDYDKDKFLFYIKNAYLRFSFIIHAYCLMPNHYHLLMETPYANLSRCMQYINSSYTTYYNKAQKRVGHLFQGRYKAIVVDKDAYLNELSRYIHLNAVAAGLSNTPYEYPWCSYHYYVGSKILPNYMETKTIMASFESKKSYRQFVAAGMLKEKFPLQKLTLKGCILGDEAFAMKIKNKYVDTNKKVRDLPDLRKLKQSVKPSQLILKLITEENSISDKEKKKITSKLSPQLCWGLSFEVI